MLIPELDGALFEFGKRSRAFDGAKHGILRKNEGLAAKVPKPVVDHAEGGLAIGGKRR